MGKHREKREARKEAAIRLQVAKEIRVEGLKRSDLDPHTATALAEYVERSAEEGTPDYIQDELNYQANRKGVDIF